MHFWVDVTYFSLLSYFGIFFAIGQYSLYVPLLYQLYIWNRFLQKIIIFNKYKDCITLSWTMNFDLYLSNYYTPEINQVNLKINTVSFYAPSLKGPPGASSVWIVRLYVCPFCPAYEQTALFKVWVVIQ